ncbi:MAG: energy-coupling factor transporter transmembrane component T [Nitrospiraceae bacterium]|nr:energy-coupling factor transporter transmembrane component T [Nitrospiraceae bacterium]
MAGKEKRKIRRQGDKALPEWLRAPEPMGGAAPVKQGINRGGGPLLERTLQEILGFLDEALFNETVSERNGFLQKVDARIKIAAIVALIVALSFKRGPLEMLPLGAFALVLAALSRVPPGAYLKRLLPPVLITAAIAAPATLNLVVKGRDVFTLFGTGGRFGLPPEVYLTSQGLMSALGLVARVSVSLALVFLATFTTRPARLIKGFCSMLPRGFLRTLAGVSYRYVFFLARRLEEFILAHKARTAGGMMAGGRARAWAGSRAASLLIISLKLKDDLAMAMEARGMGYGFREKEEKLRPRAADLAFIALSLGVLLI